MSIFTYLRQFKFPQEFRIPSPDYYSPEDISKSLEQLLHSLLEQGTNVASPVEADSLTAKENIRFLADIITGLWRLKMKMVEPRTGEPLQEMRRAFRHLESVWDALTQAGIEIIDHTNVLFDPGMSIKAISFQPTPGLDREKIIETIKPTIYRKDSRIQMGEVIVGTPEN